MLPDCDAFQEGGQLSDLMMVESIFTIGTTKIYHPSLGSNLFLRSQQYEGKDSTENCPECGLPSSSVGLGFSRVHGLWHGCCSLSLPALLHITCKDSGFGRFIAIVVRHNFFFWGGSIMLELSYVYATGWQLKFTVVTKKSRKNGQRMC